MHKWHLSLMLGVVSLTLVLPVFGAGWCGPPPGLNLDYLDPENGGRLSNVERVHFTDDVRSLRSGSTGYVIQDIEFVLNVFPNHHGGLDAMSRLAIREGASQPRRARWPIECRFQWASQRNANDGMVSLIQGVHYHRLGNRAEARTHLERAAELSPENPEVRYNVGLLLFRYGEHDAAYEHAKEAYAMGYPLPGLRNMLERAGYSLDN